MKINFSNDLGNGSVKGVINGDSINIPSVVVKKRPQDISHPEEFHTTRGKAHYLSHYLDNIDVSIQSSAIRHSGIYLVGHSAIDAGLPTQGFDVSTMVGKSQTDLALILTLSIIAGKAVEIRYNHTKNLPKSDISVSVNMVTALPIMEGISGDTTDKYRARYMNSDHVVVIRNFNNPINVHIHFNSVRVLLEGQTAIFEIHHAGQKLEQAIYSDFSAHYPMMAKEVTPQDITDVRSVLGIDIGEGTTDLAVFNADGSVNNNASTSIPWGFGHVINGAISSLQQSHYNYNTRPQVKRVMSERDTPFTHSEKSIVKDAIESQVPGFINQITSNVSKSLRNLGTGSIHIIYVYGGGAIPMARYLRGPLEAKAKAVNGHQGIPVVFLNKDYAQRMNVLGLNLVLSSLLALEGSK